MKLSSGTPAAPRVQRQEMLRRARAAAQPLRAAFPTVQALRLDLKFEGPAANVPATQAHVLYPPAAAFFEFACPYADCDGRFDLTQAVESTLRRSGQQAKGTLECSGLRVRQRGVREPCGLRLEYRLETTYQGAR
jgi:hypothetical protein